MFADRTEAAKQLVQLLARYKGKPGLVLAIPRGGVVLGQVVADFLSWPLSVLITKKISMPFQEELAMGAMAETSQPIWHTELLGSTNIGQKDKEMALKKAKDKIKNYIVKFRKGKSLKVRNQRVIVIDDGAATGQTLEAALRWLKKEKVKELIVALPVCAHDTAKRLKPMVDSWICLLEPHNLHAIGQFYKDFQQVEDKEVTRLLSQI